MSFQVRSLHIYPVKSCRGLDVPAAEAGRMGFRHDRQWMFVDHRGMFVAQRSARGLGVGIATTCLIDTELSDGMLTLRAPGMRPLQVAQHGCAGESTAVRVWDSHVSAIDQGAAAEAWATEYLSRECPGTYRLVRMADDQHRSAKSGAGELAFGDAYPFMVMSEESLVDLNQRLSRPLPINRFRPNIVIAGGDPYAEDGIDWFRIGDVQFTGMKLCVRCPITTTNQRTAERGHEPLRTLATYRKQPDGVVLGRNYNHSGGGWIRVGDSLRVEAP